MRHSILAGILVAAAIVPASAILSRDDVPVEQYIALAADPCLAGARFTVSNIGGGVGGTAVLINADTVLFSAHLLYDPMTSMIRPGTGTGTTPFMTFFTSDVYTTTYYTGWVTTPDGPYTAPFGNEYWALDPASIQVNPLYLAEPGNQANGAFDMAIGKIVPGRLVGNSVASSTFLPNAVPMRFYDTDLAAGTEITIIGNGSSGSEGHSPFTLDDPARSANTGGVSWRAAQNEMDNVFRQIYEYDFDSPDSLTSSMGSPIALALEGTTLVGDSGGAWLVNTPSGWAVAGTTIGGSAPANAAYIPTGKLATGRTLTIPQRGFGTWGLRPFRSLRPGLSL